MSQAIELPAIVIIQAQKQQTHLCSLHGDRTQDIHGKLVAQWLVDEYSKLYCQWMIA